MPLKKNDERRWVELEVLVPGTPEQVWRAIATGAGISAWFTPTAVEERVGGAITFTLDGGATSSGTVTAWEPGSRFAYEERGWSGDAPPLATEVVIVSRSGGSCVVRMVHSLFTSKDAWDDEMEGFEKGWPGFFEVLRAYLRDFTDQPVGALSAMGAYPASVQEAWKHVATALGVRGAEVGEQRTAAAGVPPLVGCVQRVQHTQEGCSVTLRLEQPAPGIALIGVHRWQSKTNAILSFYLYGERAQEVARDAQPLWRAWLAKHLAADVAG
jgi:uncharacterized protein YndB with AHSA1/START domain